MPYLYIYIYMIMNNLNRRDNVLIFWKKKKMNFEKWIGKISESYIFNKKFFVSSSTVLKFKPENRLIRLVKQALSKC